MIEPVLVSNSSACEKPRLSFFEQPSMRVEASASY
jgi:hypothetical protein